MKIAIVGSAGRKSDAQHVTISLYNKMVHDARQQISDLLVNHYNDNLLSHAMAGTTELEPIDLVSGGAALSDHIAVSLFLMDLADSLTLYLPAPWRKHQNYQAPQFQDTREGGLANYYHGKFSLAVGRPKHQSLLGIQKAADKGAVLNTDHLGFYKRNIQVGRVDALLAYTFSNTGEPKPGGTAHTWKNSNASVKIHRNLFELTEK